MRAVPSAGELSAARAYHQARIFAVLAAAKIERGTPQEECIVVG